MSLKALKMTVFCLLAAMASQCFINYKLITRLHNHTKVLYIACEAGRQTSLGLMNNQEGLIQAFLEIEKLKQGRTY